MIQGVKIKKLKCIKDDRGFLMEMLRSDDKFFKGFGQVYLTGCKKGVAKGWHYHKLQVDNFVCVSGKALVVLYDSRKESETYREVNEFKLKAPLLEELIIEKPILLQIPQFVFHGFTATDCDEARIVNIPSLPYKYEQPDEYRVVWNSTEVPYKWPKDVISGG